MTGLKKFGMLLMIGSALALAGCDGATEVASPGEGGFPGGGGGDGGGGDGGGGSGAGVCPTGFANLGLINGFRNCQIPNLITGTLNVPQVDNVVYSISGRVMIGQDRGGDALNPAPGTLSGTLTVEPGVTIFGSAGLDFIVVNRGSQIFAVGEEDDPIIFTSRQDILNTTTADSIGQWGGIVLLGRANITNCPGVDAPAQAALYGTKDCQATVEGTDALYGGNSNSDNSGSLQYVRIMYSGFTISLNNELQALTVAGVGTGTLIDHIQFHNSSDDGVEFFGGIANMKHVVITGADDDSLDFDQGYRGALQYVLSIQRAAGGNRMIESSMASLAAATTAPGFPTRRTSAAVVNFTFIGRSGFPADGHPHFNTGTNGRLYNGIVTGSNICLDIDTPDTQGTAVIFRSVYMSCTTSFDPDSDGAGPDESTQFASGTNNNTAGGVSTLTGTFINSTNETAVTPVTFASLTNDELSTAQKAYLEQVTHIGAVKDASDDWYSGWTCSVPGEPVCD
jgi:hypothetical protein